VTLTNKIEGKKNEKSKRNKRLFAITAIKSNRLSVFKKLSVGNYQIPHFYL